MAKHKYPIGTCGKILFPTIAEANTRAFYLNTIASNHSSPMRYYLCVKCRGYHLTSKPFVSQSEFEKRKKEVCSGCYHSRLDHAASGAGLCWVGKSVETTTSICPCTKFTVEPKEIS